MIQVRDRALTRFVEHPLAVVDLVLQPGDSSVASRDGLVKFSLGIHEKLIGRSGFGPGTRHSGDAGLRASRGGVVFAARDNQRLVAVGARRVDGLVERDARIAHPLQVARRLHDSGRRNGVACGLLLKLTIDPSAVVSLSGDKADVEMLEDLIVSAVNAAGQKAEDAIQSNLKGMLGGLNIPGLT